jgi:hypothetical protein
MRRAPVLASALVCVFLALPAWAGHGDSSAPPEPGTTGVATAVPNLPVPHGRPCTVQLFQDATFANFTPRTFSYSPPARCHGPWARVVLEADYSVTAGRQFDRTASIWVGDVNVYFGTTQEPSADISPVWHVERDLTDYSAWLRKPHDGRTVLGNVVNSTYTGVITGSAKLVFYPGPAPQVPDQVISLSQNPDGATNTVNPGTPQAGRTLTLPRNMVAIYMDVFAQSQASDEFWQLCVPDSVADQLQSCGGSGFRQTLVYIDGEPAGVAPVYPWIYTGGVSPALWRPIPGVQTLNFKPFRVNLTPFAAQLNDGQPHAVTLGVTNTGNHFATVANLLIYQDPHRKTVGGALVRNTLQADPGQHDSIQSQGDGQTTVTTTSTRNFSIAGYVNTSRGRVDTRVHQHVDFSSVQQFTISDTQFHQHLDQLTNVRVRTTTSGFFGHLRERTQRNYRFPLTFDYNDHLDADGMEKLDISADQAYQRMRRRYLGGRLIFHDRYRNAVHPSVRYNFDANGNLASVDPWISAQHVHYDNSAFQCFDRRITSDHYDLLMVDDGASCRHGRNRYFWSPLMNLSWHFFRGTEASLWRW